MLKAIPNFEDPKGFAEISPLSSEFVRLKDGEFFDVKMQYPILKIKNATEGCFVRQEVFEGLKKAQSLLPSGYKLRIWDAWRPFALQQELYGIYSQNIIKQFNLSDKPDEIKQRIIAQYISFPERDERNPAVHTTGGAVDVTLTDASGRELDMGTHFDAFTDKTRTDYYEADGESTVIRDNRRILYNCMTYAGFTNLPSEWWHYDFGDKFWAYYNGVPALYLGVFEEKALNLNFK